MMQGLLGFFKDSRHCAPAALKDSIMGEPLIILVLIYSWRWQISVRELFGIVKIYKTGIEERRERSNIVRNILKKETNLRLKC